ncbi:GGDEF domain-containing protein [Aliiglaciecola sp. LCG003]|uniref:GGDEF domain-containing protein n=1 Tax=Aliiglaciecola sp. LCG003 TaxID=3053655 RepID=UPI002572B2A1|nr:GGDEF domain-containing protein [Aliiglaciecola sp. LCG003]WJG11251.1 diguanylate cyclase [Aliiglaciecola sp. LCG003]
MSDNNNLAQHYSSLSMVYYALSFPESAFANAQTALEYIDPDTQPWLYHMSKLNEAQAWDLTGKPNSGVIGANAALVWAELQQDTDLIVLALYVRGSLLNSMLDYRGALRDLQRAYEIAPQASNLNRGDIAGMLALVYEYRREDSLAIPFFQEAASYHRANQNLLELSIALYGLGRANKNIGNIELGRQLLVESKQIATQVGDQQGVAYALKELAGLALAENNYQVAQQFIQQAFEIFEVSQNQYMLLDAYLTMAKIALAENDLLAVKKFLHSAQSYVDIVNMPVQAIAFDELTAQYLALSGHHQQAFELLLATMNRKQRLQSQTSTQQLHSLRSQYEIDMKDRENKLLEQKNQLQQSDLESVETRNLQLLLLFGATLLICLLLVILVYRTVQNRARFEHLANIDSLTGLANRRNVMEKLQTQIELARRHEFPLSVAIVDIDFFKKINDNYGHAGGDKVLKAIGSLFEQTFRQSDVIGRIGGEEFLIGLPHTALGDADRTLQSLSLNVKQLSDSFDLSGLSLSISIGLSLYQAGESIESLLLRCDKALYQAKRGGRDQVVTYRENHSTLLQLEV